MATVLALAAGAPGAAQTYEFTTLAGSATVHSVDGPGSVARFNQPVAVVVDSQGDAYVSDHGNNTIRKVRSGGMVTTLAGVSGARISPDGTGSEGHSDGTGSYARFKLPGPMVVDPAGNLLVHDGDDALRRVTPDGVVTTWLTLPIRDAGMAMDRSGNLFFAGREPPDVYTIQKFTPDGRSIRVAAAPGGFGSAGPNGRPYWFRHPSAVAVDGNGNVVFAEATSAFVNPFSYGWNTEYLGARVCRLGTDGSISTVAGSADHVGGADGVGEAARFTRLVGLAVDTAGNIYAADIGNHTIRKISAGGVVTTLAGQAGVYGTADGVGSAARFNSPASLAVDGNGNVLVVDSGNYTLRRISPNGQVTTLAGGTEFSASYRLEEHVDAVGSAARFDQPKGITVDSAGNLFIAESGNQAICQVTPEGVVTTVAIARAESVPGVSTVSLILPSFVAVDASSNLYVGDIRWVRRISPAGTLTTVAGARSSGNSEGPGLSVELGFLGGVVVGRDGGIVVSDGQHTIRRIAADGVVTIIAGEPGTAGSVDGRGRSARFNGLAGLAVDGAGNYFVYDTGNRAIRRISPDGAVTTVIRNPRTYDAGLGVERAVSPRWLAIDGSGNFYIAEANTVVRMTPSGSGTTIGGRVGNAASVDGTGSTARFGDIYGLAVDRRGNVYVSDALFNTIRKGVPLADPARLMNVSVLAAYAGAGDEITLGTIVGGAETSGTTPLLVRAIGPRLSVFGVTDPLADPRLEFFNDSIKIGENNDWDGTALLCYVFARVGAFPIEAGGSKDAALFLPAVGRGNHTLRVSGNGPTGGTVLTEIYDAMLDAVPAVGTPRLTNVSVLKKVGPGLTTGFMIKGEGTRKVLIRAVGPSLAGLGVGAPLLDPRIELYDGRSRRMTANDNWSEAGALARAELSAAFAQVGAFPLAADTSQDAALLITLTPGIYTVLVRGAGDTAGVALVEVYEVP